MQFFSGLNGKEVKHCSKVTFSARAQTGKFRESLLNLFSDFTWQVDHDIRQH